MTSLIPSKVFGLSRGRMDLPFTEMAKVVRSGRVGVGKKVSSTV